MVEMLCIDANGIHPCADSAEYALPTLRLLSFAFVLFQIINYEFDELIRLRSLINLESRGRFGLIQTMPNLRAIKVHQTRFLTQYVTPHCQNMPSQP